MPDSDIKRCRCKPNCNIRITRRQRHRHYAQAQYEGRADQILPSESDSESSGDDDSSDEVYGDHQDMVSVNYQSAPPTAMFQHASPLPHDRSMQSAGHPDMMDVDPILDSGSSGDSESDSEDESDESDGIQGAEFDAAALAYNEQDDFDASVTVEQLIQELEAELYLEDQTTFQNICKRPPLCIENLIILIHAWIRQ